MSLTLNFNSRITPSWKPNELDLSSMLSKISKAFFAEGYLKSGICTFALVPVFNTSIYLAISAWVSCNALTELEAPIPSILLTMSALSPIKVLISIVSNIVLFIPLTSSPFKYLITSLASKSNPPLALFPLALLVLPNHFWGVKSFSFITFKSSWRLFAPFLVNPVTVASNLFFPNLKL